MVIYLVLIYTMHHLSDGQIFSMTSIHAASSFHDDNDHRRMSMGLEWAGPRPGAPFVPWPLCAIEHVPSCP